MSQSSPEPAPGLSPVQQPIMLLSRLLRENNFTPESVPRFEQKLFYEGARRRPYLERFWVLLILATIIASCGLLADSTASVIGAMIVAPLMTPIMATAAALVIGRLDRAATSGLLVLAGVSAVIGLGWLAGTLYTGVIDFEANSQLAGRVAPSTIDLIAALASGAAGAFCMSREDVADSLPGVAIAISLVPPLCVVGIALSVGEWNGAFNALLLFVTNALAILLAGGGVLALLGLSRATAGRLTGHARRNAFIAIGLGVALVTVPLAATGQSIARAALIERQTRDVTETWLTGTNYTLREVRVVGDQADLVIVGAGGLPPLVSLAASVDRAVGQPITIVVQEIPSRTESVGGRQAGP